MFVASSWRKCLEFALRVSVIESKFVDNASHAGKGCGI